MIDLTLPAKKDETCKLEAGQWLRLNGSIIVARDRAHMRLIDSIEKNENLPVELKEQGILYAGPIIRKNKVIIGPTTSSRMDNLSEALMKKGVALTIGKGPRSKRYIDLAKEYCSPYLMTFGGAAAFLSKFVIKAKMITYGDLGPEALYRIEVKDFPAITAIDCRGKII